MWQTDKYFICQIKTNQMCPYSEMDSLSHGGETYVLQCYSSTADALKSRADEAPHPDYREFLKAL